MNFEYLNQMIKYIEEHLTENIEYKEPERIGEIKSNGNEFYSDYVNAWISKADVEAYCEFLMNKINDLIKISNKYASLLEKQEWE